VQEARVDVVYTWVDGEWPGYQESLARHAERPIDRNPNRYRDNLDLLKYSLRSLEAHAPWHGVVYLVTARPQVPRWLDVGAPGLRVVHHDEIFDPADLPTFSSFAIECCLFRIPGLGRRFLYLNDDMLLGAKVPQIELLDERARARVHLEWRSLGAERAGHPHPYEAAIGVSNGLLDARFGARRRARVRHVPIVMDVDHWQALAREFPEAVARTRQSRFRAPGTFAPDHLYPHYCLLTSRAAAVPLLRSYASAGYLGLENSRLTLFALAALERWRPALLCLNDNFGEAPDPRVVRQVRSFLDRLFPRPSRFERVAEAA
jgi:hypothetical protein